MSDSTKDRVLATRCNVNGREFTIEILPMVNGCFASITEDKYARMGAISISIKAEKKSVHSTALVPDRRGGLLAGMLGETLAGKFGGICAVSLYLREEIDAEAMKTLISEVRELVAQGLISTP
ncbi:MAG: hypothetical protein ACYC7D_09150 [Nitrososphaerales archaeon]